MKHAFFHIPTSKLPKKCQILCLACVLIAQLLASCSFINFERGPFAIRGLDIVYSEQEDITFLVWRLPQSTQPEKLHFELYLDGEYRPIDLSESIFAAEPYSCDRKYVCFQHQLRGQHSFEASPSPVRSVHRVHGVFPGSEPRFHHAPTTFDISPIALGRNTEIDPRRYDWFSEQNIPLKRSYQWQLIKSSSTPSGSGIASDCDPVLSAQWKSMPSRISVPYQWVESPHCLAARPHASRGNSVLIKIPFAPSAELISEMQDYLPVREEHPVLFGILFDLHIAHEERCKHIQSTLHQSISAQIHAYADKRDSTAVDLGVYTPISRVTGEGFDGCQQGNQHALPLTQMFSDAMEAAASFDTERVPVIWIYVNNVELPPSEDVWEQLLDFDQLARQSNKLFTFSWAIASNTVMFSWSWDWTTAWKPVSDKILQSEIQSFAAHHIPFRSMLHDRDTEVRITRPYGSQAPRYMKICSATPSLASIHTSSPDSQYSPNSLITWPQSGEVSYRIVLGVQHLVAFQTYRQQRVKVAVEVCERFCNNPFRSRAGRDYESWKGSSECQWAP